MSEIFLDTETTGLSYRNGDKIVEIACVETDDLVPTGKVFHKLINPKREVPNEAYKVHGFSTDFLATKETFDKYAISFVEFIKGKKLIIHNASFDVGFLNNELSTINEYIIKKENVVDTLDLARAKFPGSSNSLDSLCRRFNIDLSRRAKHNALLDCELLREVYINLLDAKEPRLIFSNDQDRSENNLDDKKISKYNKTILKLTEAEVEKHKIFIKKEIPKNHY